MGEDPKRGFPLFEPGQLLQIPVTGAFPEKYVSTHHILAILLDDIEMLRDRFMGKLGEEPKVSRGGRSVAGTAEWQKLKETAAV